MSLDFMSPEFVSSEFVPTEFVGMIAAVHTPRNPKFVNNFKLQHGEQYRPVTILLYITSFTHILDEVHLYDALETDTVLGEESKTVEYKTWVGELTVPEPDRPLIATKENTRAVYLPTVKGMSLVELNTARTDMVLRMDCQINNLGYPRLPIRKMGPKALLRTDGGKGRIIHPFKKATVIRISCH